MNEIISSEQNKEIISWLQSYGISIEQDQLNKILSDEEKRAQVYNDNQKESKDVKNSRGKSNFEYQKYVLVQQLLNLMKKNQLQRKSQELLLSTYEYTALQQEHQLYSFQLRNCLDKKEDLSLMAQHDLNDLAQLCIVNNIQPSSAEASTISKEDSDPLTDLIEIKIKNILFEYQYLNEKIQKRNLKCKEVLHPSLQRKKILLEVLKNLWETQIKTEKKQLDLQSQKLEMEANKMSKKNKEESERLVEEEEKENKNNQNMRKQKRENNTYKTEEQNQEIKELNYTLMEQKSHDIKYDELIIQKMMQTIQIHYKSLPPDLKLARKKLEDLKLEVLNLKSSLQIQK